MLIVLLFVVLLALKLAAIALVYSTPPIVPLIIIGAMIAIAHYIEPTAATQRPQKVPAKREAGR